MFSGARLLHLVLLIIIVAGLAFALTAKADPLGDAIKRSLNTFWKQTGDHVRARSFECRRSGQGFVCHASFIMLGSQQPPGCVIYHLDGHYRIVGKPKVESCDRTA